MSSLSLISVDTCYVYRWIERNDLPSLKLPKFDFARVETTLERVLNISSGIPVLWHVLFSASARDRNNSIG